MVIRNPNVKKNMEIYNGFLPFAPKYTLSQSIFWNHKLYNLRNSNFIFSFLRETCHTHWGTVFDLTCLRTGYWEDYLDLYGGSNKRLRNVKFRNLYSPLHIIRVIKPTKKKWRGQIPRVRRLTDAWKCGWEN